MLGKINIFRIIRDHFRTFRSIRNGKIILEEIFIFWILPILIGVYIVILEKYRFDKEYINILIASLSILAGFLFNLLAMIFGFMDKLQANANDDVKIALTKEIHSNVSFCILLSIVCIIGLLLCNLRINWLTTLFNVIGVSGSIMFFLTLIMILKRIYIIMSKEV